MARLLIHPGEHLAAELKALNMSANEHVQRGRKTLLRV